MKRIIFVCSGNICRSPMAAGLAKEKFTHRDIKAAVISCGTLKLNGHRAARFAIEAMKEVGIDISEHRSQGINTAMLRVADDIVVMSPEHEAFVLGSDPQLRPKIVRMWEHSARELKEIADPVSKSLDHFRICRDLLDECLDTWIETWK